VKTPEQLFEIYLTSVGHGSTLLLNVPPDQRGLFNDIDVRALQGFKKLLQTTFAHNLAVHAPVTADNYRGHDKAFAPANLTDGDKNTYWATDDAAHSGSFTINLGKPQTVQYIVLQEYIRLGQRVKSFTVEVWKDNAWQKIADATTIGYKRILRVTPVQTDKIRVNITDAKACPVLAAAEVY
jgi:alpha-L-fucosidase